jgi:L-ascorbate metabolism protein UlaG (beta-lactamase superfamily)
MKLIKRILKMTGLIIAGGILLLAISGILFVNFYPSIGGSHSDEKIEIFKKSGHYQEGKFVNLIYTSMDIGFGKFMSIMKDWILGVPNQTPEEPLPVVPVDSMTIASKHDSLARVIWFGHSAFLLEINGKNILLDPMLGDYTGPHPWLGPSRFSDGIPIEIAKLPQIDAVVYSHDHYDHLDYETVLKLKDKVKKFFLPLGVGSHLAAWGVDEDRIHELSWWDEIEMEGLKFVSAPARHFSGRGILDRNTTMWASWIIKSENFTVYFSGDSGYGPHFEEIGEKYGPFDFAMLECGQYDLRWESVHLLPEQTAQAAIDINAKLAMPIHWGAFVLALHSWKDPLERLSPKAEELGVDVITPKIGEQININKANVEDNDWWVTWN